jgi:hypothetical protein
MTRERPKTLQELYENFFKKISKSEVLHFQKLEQQRKTLKVSEASKWDVENDVDGKNGIDFAIQCHPQDKHVCDGESGIDEIYNGI